MICNVVWCEYYTGEDCGRTWCPAHLISNTIDVNTVITDDTKNDLVAVVHCKDCIYGVENGELCERKVYLCSAMTNPNEFYGDFYCAFGERKESDS